MFKKILKLFAIIIVLAAIAFFYFAPEYVDKSKNTILNKNTPAAKQSWYDSIPYIADLHCDALLWNRNL
jgi:membrane dipeptidase